MSLTIHVSADGVRLPMARARVSEIAQRVLAAEGIREAMLSVTFLGTRAMAALNRKHLGHRGATDVISFAFAESDRRGPVVGDIYIAPDVARANARRHGIAIREETARLIVHGVLHVLGYDHAEDDSRVTSAMWHRQERLLAKVSGAARA
ncbi:MAG TPA: rRNA maturation RNase YbeY [Gemmatimonadaceae bacterium]|nr:rRNA maturation RNase YbeY [Gemmatimonadaceae bacterium]